MRKTVFTILLVLSVSSFSKAQTTEQLSDGYVKSGTAAPAAAQGNTDTITTPFKQQQRLQFGMTMGTGVVFSSGAGAGMFTYLAPHISYRVTPKFTVSGGVMLATNRGNNMPIYGSSEAGSMLYYRPAVSGLVYGSGSYQLTDKLTLTGTLFGGTQTYNLPGLNPQSYNLNTYGGALNMEYKLGNGASFGAGVSISHGPGLDNGYASPASPFHSSPFFSH